MNLPMATTQTLLTTPGTGGRRASVERTTKETRISAAINLDGTGVYDVKTGIGFLDHMLEQLSRHGLIDLSPQGRGRPAHRLPPHDRGHRHRARPGAGARRWATARASGATARRT
jgi:hypothetical protein